MYIDSAVVKTEIVASSHLPSLHALVRLRIYPTTLRTYNYALSIGHLLFIFVRDGITRSAYDYV